VGDRADQAAPDEPADLTRLEQNVRAVIAGRVTVIEGSGRYRVEIDVADGASATARHAASSAASCPSQDGGNAPRSPGASRTPDQTSGKDARAPMPSGAAVEKRSSHVPPRRGSKRATARGRRRCLGLAPQRRSTYDAPPEAHRATVGDQRLR
jgi:hypothetical protein